MRNKDKPKPDPDLISYVEKGCFPRWFVITFTCISGAVILFCLVCMIISRFI